MIHPTREDNAIIPPILIVLDLCQTLTPLMLPPTSNLQLSTTGQVLARASTSALMHQAVQNGALISPSLGGGSGLSPLGALSPMGLTALLGGVPTPRGAGGGIGTLGILQVGGGGGKDASSKRMDMTNIVLRLSMSLPSPRTTGE